MFGDVDLEVTSVGCDIELVINFRGYSFGQIKKPPQLNGKVHET